MKKIVLCSTLIFASLIISCRPFNVLENADVLNVDDVIVNKVILPSGSPKFTVEAQGLADQCANIVDVEELAREEIESNEVFTFKINLRINPECASATNDGGNGLSSGNDEPVLVSLKTPILYPFEENRTYKLRFLNTDGSFYEENIILIPITGN